MKPKMYCVLITRNGTETISRIFTTIRAARTWVKWCRKQHYAVRIMDQIGGIEVM